MADPDRTDAPAPAPAGDHVTPGTSDAAPEQAAPDQAAPPAADDDPKAKFRAALERKKAAHHRTAQGPGNTGTVHGAGTAGPSQRTFRRRSGSS